MKVVGREEARREPPLPDLLQVKCNTSNVPRTALHMYAQGIGPGGDSRTVLMDRSGDRKRPREGLLSRLKREELRKNASSSSSSTSSSITTMLTLSSFLRFTFTSVFLILGSLFAT